MAVILRYFAEFGSFGANYVTLVEVRPTLSATKKSKPKNVVFDNMLFIAIFSEIIENECAKGSHPHSTTEIRLVQHCAAISATAELLFYL